MSLSPFGAAPHFYVSTARHAGAVTVVACGAFTAPGATDVIVARGSRLEVLAFEASGDVGDEGGGSGGGGLRTLFELPIHGRIATMELAQVKVRAG